MNAPDNKLAPPAALHAPADDASLPERPAPRKGRGRARR